MVPLFASQGGGSGRGFGRNFGGSSGLYQFTSHTFSDAGLIGKTGPTSSQLRTAYSSETWAQNSSFLDSLNGIQVWTVPVTGTYQIECRGGGGANNGSFSNGYAVRANFSLIQGQLLRVVVGQRGTWTTQNAGGGGGASYVYDPSNMSLPMIVGAGGGGNGHTSTSSLQNGVIGDGAASHPIGTGSIGNGGIAGCCGHGGSGWLSQGAEASETISSPSTRQTINRPNALNSTNPIGGEKFSAGNSTLTQGGFGGGGGGSGNSGYGGGGGGYSGGSGGQCCSGSNEFGGGGGSYVNTSGSSRANLGNTGSTGYVTITRL
jgi:hypothetical protein